jgi:hypothetical protein
VVNKKTLPKELQKKRKSRPAGLLSKTSNESMEKIESAYTAENIRLLDLLSEHYGVANSEKKYLELSYLLAYDFIPGFQEISIKRSSKWTNKLEALLIVDIDTLTEKPSKGVSYVTKLLAKKSRWSTFLSDYCTDNCTADSKKSETLRKRYYAAKKKANVAKEVNKLILFKKIIGEEVYKEIIFSHP